MWTCRSPPYQPSAAGSKRRGGSTSTSASPVTVRSTTSNSSPRVHVTVSVVDGTVSVTSSAWKNGRAADVPLVQHAVGEPRAAGGVGDRPPRAAGRAQPQPGARHRGDGGGERHRFTVDRHVGRAVDVDGRNARPARSHRERVARDDGGHLAVGVDDHVQRHRHPGDHRPRWSAVDGDPAVADPHHDDARRRVGADHVAHGPRPVAGVPYAAKTSPSAANRAQRNISMRSSPQSQPRSAERPR